MTCTLTQGAANDYVEREFKFPSRSRITIIRADIAIASHVILDEDHIFLGIAKGAVSAITPPSDNQCVWYKDYLQVGNQAGGVDLSWTIQNLPSFNNDKFTCWFDTDSYAALALTAYFTLLVDIKPIQGV